MTTPREPRPDRTTDPTGGPGDPDRPGDAASRTAGGIWHLRIDRAADAAVGSSAGGAPGTPWTVSTFADGEWKVISRHPTEDSARAAVASMESTGNDEWR